MTVHDTSYFISEHKQFRNASDLHKNTYSFLRLNQNYKYQTYSHEEITNHLENAKLNLTTPSRLAKSYDENKDGNAVGKDCLLWDTNTT